MSAMPGTGRRAHGGLYFLGMDWTIRQDMPLGQLAREKPTSLLKSQRESEREGVRRVNRRGEESQAQWGLERDRRAEKTKARETTTVTRRDGRRRWEGWEKWAASAATRGSICRDPCRM